MVQLPALTMITGGARSGKSTYGEHLFGHHSEPVLYVATALSRDKEMEQRIRDHRSQRPKHWHTLEAYRDFSNVLPQYKGKVSGVIVDCITLMVTQLMLDQYQGKWEKMKREESIVIEDEVNSQITDLLDALEALHVPAVMITNETGWGIVPENRLSRDFRDIAGRGNQTVARRADRVVLMVAGYPVTVK